MWLSTNILTTIIPQSPTQLLHFYGLRGLSGLGWASLSRSLLCSSSCFLTSPMDKLPQFWINCLVFTFLFFLYWFSDSIWWICCCNRREFCMVISAVFIIFITSSTADGDTVPLRYSIFFFCCSSWYILAGICPTPEDRKCPTRNAGLWNEV